MKLDSKSSLFHRNITRCQIIKDLPGGKHYNGS
jgi:hypothetical protein